MKKLLKKILRNWLFKDEELPPMKILHVPYEVVVLRTQSEINPRNALHVHPSEMMDFLLCEMRKELMEIACKSGAFEVERIENNQKSVLKMNLKIVKPK